MGLFDFAINDAIDFDNSSETSKKIMVNNLIKNNEILAKCLEFSNDENLKNDIEKQIEANNKLISSSAREILNKVKTNVCDYLTKSILDIYNVLTKGKKSNNIIISISDKLFDLRDEWKNASFNKIENELKSITLKILNECKSDIEEISNDYKKHIVKLMSITTYFSRIKSELNNNLIFK